ncbi:MotE family protein [Metabacillus sp. RGM 3146]|uniref:MotE family protein n=1 Tax=Metabacillus sp. RGM 3146 TaxID=3401092 RepID=UPI003B9C8526
MDNTKKEDGKLQWFLFVIVIPVFFTAVLAIIILTIAGFDVTGPFKQISNNVPFISAMTGAEKTGAQKQETSDAKSHGNDSRQIEIADQKKTISMQKQDIKALENDAALKQFKVQQLSQQVLELQHQLDDAAKKDQQSQQKDMSSIYTKMTSKKTAEILPVLGDKEAVKILSALNDDQIAGILEKMSAQDAAKYTKLMAGQK